MAISTDVIRSLKSIKNKFTYEYYEKWGKNVEVVICFVYFFGKINIKGTLLVNDLSK